MLDPQAPIRPVQRSELDILLAHIVRCRDVADSAVARLRLEDFDSSTERSHLTVFCVVRDFVREHGELPSGPVMDSRLEAFSFITPELADPQIQAGLFQLAAYCYEYRKEDLLSSYALDIMQTLLLQRRVGVMARDLSESGGLTVDSIRQLSARADESIISESIATRPFDQLILGATPRIATGIDVLDLMMGGGVRPRELYGFLAPSGGGKTTFSNQLAVSCARQKRHMAYFTYEDPPNAEFLVGVYACAAGVERAIVEKAQRPQDLPESARVRLAKAREELGPYLHYYDMSMQTNRRVGAMGPSEIEAVMRDLQTKGSPPFGFVVDYFWIMATRYFDQWEPAKGKGSKKLEERTFAQRLMDELKVIAGRYSCWGWINQQLAPSESSKSRDMKWQDAAEFKSFAWNLSGCFALTMLDEHGVGVLNYSKARNTKTGKQPIRLRGELARFEALSDDIVFDERQKKYIARDQVNAVAADDAKGNYEGRSAGSLGI